MIVILSNKVTMLKKIIAILLSGIISMIFSSVFKSQKTKRWYNAKDSGRYLGI